MDELGKSHEDSLLGVPVRIRPKQLPLYIEMMKSASEQLIPADSPAPLQAQF